MMLRNQSLITNKILLNKVEFNQLGSTLFLQNYIDRNIRNSCNRTAKIKRLVKRNEISEKEKTIKNGEKTVKLHKFVKKFEKTLAKKKFLCYYKIIEIEILKGD